MQFEKDMASAHRALFGQARDHLVNKRGFIEIRKSRITTYSDKNGGICHMRTMPHGIDFGFLKGARMVDDFGRLKGNGKAMRVLPMAEFDETLVEYYLDQAVQLNH